MISNSFAKGLKRSTLALALSMCFVGAAIAADSGGLRISISSANGQPVAGATVKASSPSSLSFKSGVTDANGNVNLVGLDPATNYTIEVVAAGYSPFNASKVAVVSDKNLSVGYVLGRSGSADATTLDAVVVTGSSLAAVDTTSATVSTVLTLEQVESLPTARSYQSYLQLVPGVKPSTNGNPSSKSGINYQDIAGATGSSTDNLYYIDGVNVTDPLTGTFGANLNSEIIQELQVLTGGIPAQFAGGSGLVSKVVTKSGGNEFHGSVNYYLQNSDLVAKDKHLAANKFSTYDAAVTLGGPIIKDKLWFFGSYQKKSREEDVSNAVTQGIQRTVSQDSSLAFGKLTWQITDDDRVTATFFNDPLTQSGSLNPTTVNSRSNITEQGGDNYKFEYSHDWANLSIGAYAFQHEGQLSTLASTADPFNDVAYHTGRDTKTNADLQLGGAGQNTFTSRDNKEFGFNLDYYLNTDNWGDHSIGAGYLQREGSYTQQVSYLGAGAAGSRYTSVGAADAGISLATYLSNGYGWTGTRSISTSDLGRIAAATGLTTAQLLAKTFSDTTGNPDGQVNMYRIFQSKNAGQAYTVTAEQTAGYLQDKWTMGQWSANIGARFERNELVNSAGASIHKFDWDIAPRLSLAYDLGGDGRSKVFAFYGRYFDPIRADMANFAGAVTGPTTDEQINIDGTWYTFRQRGPGDAAMAPSTKTPYTDEMMLGFATTFGSDVGFSVTLTNRKTRDLMEDYDFALYSNPNQVCGTDKACPSSSFYIPYSYFGYTGVPPVNYVLGTLLGGKRDYTGFEVTLQKYKSDNWQASGTYTFNGARGNSNSDGNADFQGDWIALDPRAPNQYGPQPGNIKHQVKGWAAYEFDFGLELSGVFNWNSGVLYSRTFSAYRRNLPEMSDGYLLDGVFDSWLLPGAVAGETGPAYYTLDLRAKYTRALPVGSLEVFLDVFNILDKQSATSEQDLLAGDGVYDFGQANAWVQPRRAYLGVRYKF